MARELVAGRGPVAPVYGDLVGARGEGVVHARYPVGQSLFLAPFHLAMSPALWAMPAAQRERAGELAMALTYFPLMGAVAVVLLFFLAGALGASPRGAARFAVLLGVAGPLLYYGAEPVEAAQSLVFLLGGLLVGLRALAGGAVWVGGLYGAVFLLCINTWARPAGAVDSIVFCGVLGWLALRGGHRGAALHLAAGLVLWGGVSLAIFGVDNWWRFGDPLRNGYRVWFEAQGVAPFSNPPWRGLVEPLVGVNFGVLWTCPLLLAAAVGWRRGGMGRGGRAIVVGGVVAALLGVVLLCRYVAFAGFVGFGPRFMAHLVPLMLLPILPLLEGDRAPRWLMALGAVGLVVQLGGTALSWNLEAQQQGPAPPGELFMEQRDIGAPGLLLARARNCWWKVRGNLLEETLRLGGMESADRLVTSATEWDFFWVRARRQGRGAAMGTAALAMLLAAGAGAAGRRLRRVPPG